MRYELHYRNGIKKYDSLDQVEIVTKTLTQPYVVYKFVESKMHQHMEEFEIFGKEGVKELMKDLRRGVIISDLVKKYHVTFYTITKYIRKCKSEYESIK